MYNIKGRVGGTVVDLTITIDGKATGEMMVEVSATMMKGLPRIMEVMQKMMPTLLKLVAAIEKKLK